MAKKQKKIKKKKKGAAGIQLLLIFSVLLGVLFLPTTVMLLIGLVPTFVVFFVNIQKKKAKVVTVGTLNLAGCMPYVFQLWQQENDFNASMNIVLDPMTIIIMYGAACVGYVMDWALTGIVAVMMLERGKKRLKLIKKRQAEMVERWGKKVTGEIPLDQDGFPVEKN